MRYCHFGVLPVSYSDSDSDISALKIIPYAEFPANFAAFYMAVKYTSDVTHTIVRLIIMLHYSLNYNIHVFPLKMFEMLSLTHG